LDRRTALGEGAKLIFRSTDPSEFKVVTRKSLVDGENSFKALEKQLVFTGPELLVTFEVNGGTDGTMPSNAEKKWGWAMLVVASSDAYEKAEVSIRLSRSALTERGSGNNSPRTAPHTAVSSAPTSPTAASKDNDSALVELTQVEEEAFLENLRSIHAASTTASHATFVVPDQAPTVAADAVQEPVAAGPPSDPSPLSIALATETAAAVAAAAAAAFVEARTGTLAAANSGEMDETVTTAFLRIAAASASSPAFVAALAATTASTAISSDAAELMVRSVPVVEPTASFSVVGSVITSAAPAPAPASTEAAVSPTVPADSDDSARMDRILARLKHTGGYQSGTLVLPNASDSEIVLERPYGEHRACNTNVTVFLEWTPTTAASGKVAENSSNIAKKIEVVKFLSAEKKVKQRVKISGSSVQYHVVVITPAPAAITPTLTIPSTAPAAESTATPAVSTTIAPLLLTAAADVVSGATSSTATSSSLVLMTTSATATVSRDESIATTGFPAVDAALDAASSGEPLELHATEGTSSSTAAGAAPPQSPTPFLLESRILDVWNCPICTFSNSMASAQCGMCTTDRPGTSTGADTGAPVPAAAGAGWWCSVCTFINPLSATQCTMCESRREDVPDAAHDASDEEEGTDLMEGSDVAASTALQISYADSPPLSPSTMRRAGEFSYAEGTDGRGKRKVKFRPNGDSAGDGSNSGVYDILVISVRSKLSADGNFYSRLSAAMAPLDVNTATPRLLPRQLSEMMSSWTPEADAVLLEYINATCVGNAEAISAFYAYSNNALGLLPAKFLEYKYSQALSSFNVLDIQARLLLLGAFNKALEDLLPLINLNNTDLQSLGAMLRRCNRYVFLSTKQGTLDKIITATTARSGPALPASLILNNMTALASRDNGETEPHNSQCCFVQAFRQLQHKNPIVYKHIFASDRVFQITYHAESGIDAGGVFREGVSAMVQDLFSSAEHFNLFILCPNGQHETHLNCEKFVPNPKHTGPLAISMFEFVGKLMAMSLRAKLMLPFELPSLVWKKLGGEDPDLSDLHAIDAITCQLLRALQHCDEDGVVDQETFADKYGTKLMWTYNGSDGVERELYKGSSTRAVTYETRLEYCTALQAARLQEFDDQVEALSRGFQSVFPERILQLFTWDQLEVLVSGSPTVDIDMWKLHTVNGVSIKLFNLFWKVMESLTEKEQSMFIRFAWGRSRLPPPKEFTTKMRLTPGEGRLPVAHTCFFSIELPSYENEEEMRHGLLTAIHFGVGGVLVT